MATESINFKFTSGHVLFLITLLASLYSVWTGLKAWNQSTAETIQRDTMVDASMLEQKKHHEAIQTLQTKLTEIEKKNIELKFELDKVASRTWNADAVHDAAITELKKK